VGRWALGVWAWGVGRGGGAFERDVERVRSVVLQVSFGEISQTGGLVLIGKAAVLKTAAGNRLQVRVLCPPLLLGIDTPVRAQTGVRTARRAAKAAKAANAGRTRAFPLDAALFQARPIRVRRIHRQRRAACGKEAGRRPIGTS
jgi:hypothetical protein